MEENKMEMETVHYFESDYDCIIFCLCSEKISAVDSIGTQDWQKVTCKDCIDKRRRRSAP